MTASATGCAPSALSPVANCRRALPSSAPPPADRTRSRATPTAATAKLAALIVTPMAGRPVSSSKPPIAGPSTTTRFSSAEKMELAAARSFSPTMSGVSAPAAGRYGVSTAAATAMSARMIQSGASAATAIAIPAMTTALASAETIMTVVRW